MKYRHHEFDARYRGLRDLLDPVDWQGRDFEAFDLRPFLDEVLPTLPVPAGEPWAFEYGTGTGPGACYLAERGFRVDAIDTSPAAIDLARRFATSKSLIIGFEVGDVTRLLRRDRIYDLVVDNFCLHNLITDDDRRRALANVRGLLGPGGHFIIGTSVFNPARDYSEEIRDKRTGIVYSPFKENSANFEDVRRIGGAWYYARIRHVEPAALRAELEAAGFRVISQPRGGRLVCTRDAPDRASRG